MPFKGKDTISTLMAVAMEEPSTLCELDPDLPRGLSNLVKKLMEKRPENRPPSAKAVVEAIGELEKAPAAQPALLKKTPFTRSRDEEDEGKTKIKKDKGRDREGTIKEPDPDRPAKKKRKRSRLAETLKEKSTPLIFFSVLGLLALVAVLVVAFKGDKPKESGLAQNDGKKNDSGGKDTNPGTTGGVQPLTSSKEPEKYITNAINLKLAYIPAGEFMMGSTNQEIESFKKEPGLWVVIRSKWEEPQHKVKITKPFYLGIYEVTQGQYAKVMAKNPSFFKETPDHPVENVTWHEAVEFCTKLSELPQEKKAGRVYRLPTEAEWEYACRAGTITVFHYGNSLSSKQANFDGQWPSGGAEKGPKIGKTVKVGSYQPNPWGLFDMHGNLGEWCLDGLRDYTKNPMVDPQGPTSPGSPRAVRGPDWWHHASHCRSAFRCQDPPESHDSNVGFRVLCELRQPSTDLKAKDNIPPPGFRLGPLTSGQGSLVSLFDRKDPLAGWEGLMEYWSYKDGNLVGAAPKGLKFNTFLCSKEKYRDFELSFQVLLKGAKANSGVQIRSQIIDPLKFTVKGPQVDMGDIYWGSLYGEAFGGMMKQAPADLVNKFLKPNDFNDFFIKCAGNHVTIMLNRKVTVDEDFPNMPREGIIAWQLHAGPPMEVVFRNIRFKNLN